MATLDEIVAGLIAFRDTTYDKLDVLDVKIEIIKTLVETKHNLYQVCTTCGGTGKDFYYDDSQPGVQLERTCPFCEGNKEIPWGKIKE